MKISVYADDIEGLCKNLKVKEKPLEWIHIATEITKICKNIVEQSAELAMKDKSEQVELNI